MSVDAISVISIEEITINGEPKEDREEKEIAVSKVSNLHHFLLIFAIIAFGIICVVPWTTIPRTNTIIYPSYWMEPCLPISTIWMLKSAADCLNLTIYLKEKSLVSFKVYLKVFLSYEIPNLVIWILCYLTWCIYFGYNHPTPYLYVVGIFTSLMFAIWSWFILPPHLLAKEDFRRKLRGYMLYIFWTYVIVTQYEILSYLFANSPAALQFIVPFIVSARREFDKRVRSKLVNKIMGQQDESAAVLLTATVNSTNAFFIAVRLVGAELSTVVCAVAIDFIFHMRAAYKIINEHTKVTNEEPTNQNIRNLDDITNLVLTELIEGLCPIMYGVCMGMAYYGPNSHLLANIGSSFWGKKIENIGRLFVTMVSLFVFDTISAILNAALLWTTLNINMLHEFCRVLHNYWFLIAIQLGFVMAFYFIGNDINLADDKTDKLQWITDEGGEKLIYNSSDVTDQEKAMLLSGTY